MNSGLILSPNLIKLERCFGSFVNVLTTLLSSPNVYRCCSNGVYIQLDSLVNYYFTKSEIDCFLSLDDYFDSETLSVLKNIKTTINSLR